MLLERQRLYVSAYSSLNTLSQPRLAGPRVNANCRTERSPAPARRFEECAILTRFTPIPAYWVALAFIIMLAEFLTGPLVHLGVAYTIPVALAAWYHGWRWGAAIGAAMPLLRFAYSTLELWHSEGTLAVWAPNAAVAAVVLVSAAVATNRIAYKTRRATLTIRMLEEVLPQRFRHQKLDALDQWSGPAAGAERAGAFNDAGEICAQSGAYAEAMAYFGRALDAYLETRAVTAAAAMCQKILDLSPESVRPRATLALLALGSNSSATAEERIHEYVEAARKAGQEELAINRLHVMAEATDHRKVRAIIASHLSSLGDKRGSQEILFQLSSDLPEPAPLPEAERWSRLLRVALMGPQELMRLADRSRHDELEI